MNKTLFCALCCVSVAGFSAEKTEQESSLSSFLEATALSSHEYKELCRLGSVISKFDVILRFLEPWKQLKDELNGFFEPLEYFYKSRIRLNLLDQKSAEREIHIYQLSTEIESLEKKVQSHLRSFSPGMFYLQGSAFYESYCHDLVDDIQEVLPLLKND